MFQYVPTFVPNKVLIIGGGGTGSRLVPLLAQFLKTCAWIQNPEITIVDDDVVEEKNLLRQNFISVDVGKPKAEVLAQRYSRAFNIPITPVVKRVQPAYGRYAEIAEPELEDVTMMRDLFGRYINNSVVVMCVDSPEARRHIVGQVMAASQGQGTMLLIDSGNENDFGQINISTGRLTDVGTSRSILRSWNGKMMGDQIIPLIPMDLDYFAKMKSETTLSCADLDQTMAINTMMAVTMFGIIQNLVYAKPISFHRLNVSLAHGVTPEYMNPAFIERVGSPTQYLTNEPFLRPGCEAPVYALPISKELMAFEISTASPARKAIKDAEEEAKTAAKNAKDAADKVIAEKAVQEAMAMYGWKRPEDKTEGLTGIPKAKEELVSLLQQDFEAKLQEEEKTPKSKVKKVTRKSDSARDELIDEIVNSFGIPSASWE